MQRSKGVRGACVWDCLREVRQKCGGLHEQKIINGGRYLEPILITKSTITEKNASNFKLKENNVFENS